MAGTPRLVICSICGPAGPLELPESVVAPQRDFITGGERSLYELAVGAASLGIDVELRGAINGPILDELAAAAGARPNVGLAPRRPDSGDLIVIPEAPDIELLATAHLSSARWVLHMLAPPGLWGWSFRPGWSEGDPMRVPVESVGTPATFQAIAGLGFAMWTNARGIAAAGARAGTAVEWLGTGTPVPFPSPGPRAFDVAVVENNRWSTWANEVVARLPGVKVKRIGATPDVYSLCAPLGEARVLVWPSRIEGMSRLPREARGVGTVPVALDTNPFALLEDHGQGIVLVDDLDGIERETRALLDDPGRLDKLSAEAADSARAQTDWQTFLGRVEAAIAAAVGPSDREDPSGFARERFGDHLRAKAVEADGRIRDLESESEQLRQRLVQSQSEGDDLRERLEPLEQSLALALAERDAIVREREELRVQHERLEEAHGEVSAALDAYRNRLSSRLLDRSLLGRGWGALKRRLERP